MSQNDSGSDREHSPEIFYRGIEREIVLDDDTGEFFIPLSKEDLVRDKGEPFTFKEVNSFEDVKDALLGDEDLKWKVKQGLGCLSEHFEVLCSSTWYFKDMTENEYQALIEGLLTAVNVCCDRMDGMAKSTSASKRIFRSRFKVAFFVLSSYINQLESLIHQNIASAVQKKGNQKNRGEKWLTELRYKSLKCLRAVVGHGAKLNLLFDADELEEGFSKLLLTTLLRFLEDEHIASLKNDLANESKLLIEALSETITEFGMLSDFLNHVMILFNRHDAAGEITSEVIAHAHKNKKCTDDFLETVFRALEANMDDIALDNSIGKAYANFLNRLSPDLAAVVVASNCIEVLDELMKSEANSVRSGCITVLTKAIMKLPKTEAPELHTRNCLALILNQLNDEHSLVRAKALHSIMDLANHDCIPPLQYREIVEQVIRKTGFSDKTQTVRKAGLQCLQALLDLRPEILANSIEKLQAKLLDAGPKLEALLTPDLLDLWTKPWIIQTDWIRLEQQISQTIIQFSIDKNIPINIMVTAKATREYEKLVNKIAAALDVNDGVTASFYLLCAAKMFPNEQIIVDHHLQGFLAEIGFDVLPHRVASFCECLRKICSDAQQKESSSSKNLDALLFIFLRSKTDAVRKAALDIQLIRDAILIRKKLTLRTEKWEKTLQLMIASDITEIGSFLTHLDSLGFKDGSYVLRRFPAFFCSETKEVRDAALNSYRSYLLGETAVELVQGDIDILVTKLMWELPSNSAVNFSTIKLLFKDQVARSMVAVAEKLLQIAISVNKAEEVWRACLALSVLPMSTDKTISKRLVELSDRCVSEPYDARLICTFCDVLIKIGKSPMAKEDVSTHGNQKFSLDAMNNLLVTFLKIAKYYFYYPLARGQTQIFGKIIEALFAISEDPSKTMGALMYFTLKRLEDKTNSGELNGNDSVPLGGRHYILYFGATTVFLFANWIENTFSQSAARKEKPSAPKKDAVEFDENEPDGPSADDRGKATVLKMRQSLFSVANHEGISGFTAGIPLLERMIVQICHLDISFRGHAVGLVSYMALMRLMLISEHLCHRHMELLWTTLETTPSLELKKVIIVGISDIAVRFVNLIQPHTKKFSLQLHHEDSSIRYQALMAVVRLIVNDLVKIREQQCDIALLICDADERVSSIAKGFFKEKVPKQNILNMLPLLFTREDFFNRLSPEHLQQVLLYLIELVKKTPTDNDSLVEVFFENLQKDRPPRVNQLLAYGLSIVGPTMTEKVWSNIRDQFFSIKKVVSEDEVVEEFLNTMIAGLKKKLPEDKKRIADDLARKLTDMKEDKGKKSDKSSQVKKDVSVKSDVRSSRQHGKPPKKHRVTNSDDSDEESDTQKPRKKRKPSKRRVRNTTNQDSDQSSDEGSHTRNCVGSSKRKSSTAKKTMCNKP